MSVSRYLPNDLQKAGWSYFEYVKYRIFHNRVVAIHNRELRDLRATVSYQPKPETVAAIERVTK